MKVALAQTNPVVGDLEGNLEKALGFLKRAEEARADFVVFPELTFIGYPPKDLLQRAGFIEGNLSTLDAFAREVGKTAAVVGFVDRDTSGRTPPLLNAAALIHRGRVLSVHHKSLLPTYDVFDEVRYFSPADRVTAAHLGNERLGITICEDVWNDESFWSTRKYTTNPVAELARRDVEFFVNISASPYVFGKRDLRMNMLSKLALAHRKPLVFVNQVGANDELVFDGSSAVFSAQGRLIARAAAFEEELVTVELGARNETVESAAEDIGDLHAALVVGLRDYVTKSGFTKAVVGLSGGIDSAVTACIAAAALGRGNVRAVSLPGPYSSEHSVADAQALAGHLAIRLETVRINDVFETIEEGLRHVFVKGGTDVTEENIQARIRGTVLMALSNKFGELLLATGNKSELAVGYCTLYGDMCGGLAPLGDVPKTKVYEIARFINRDREIIPESTLTKPPSAELKPDQTDQDTLPPYDVLDEVLQAYIEDGKDAAAIVAMGVPEETVRWVIGRVNRYEYKRRQAPPVIKVTAKAFGTGRRMPIVQRWQ